jgi:cytochrome c peroxidase
MHDGRFKTLEEVIDFYVHQVQPHPNLSFVLKTNISDEQLSNLIDSLANVGIFINNFEQLSQYIPDSGEPIKLNLTNNEKKALVDFLKTFSDRQFIVDPRFSDPFN